MKTGSFEETWISILAMSSRGMMGLYSAGIDQLLVNGFI